MPTHNPCRRPVQPLARPRQAAVARGRRGRGRRRIHRVSPERRRDAVHAGPCCSDCCWRTDLTCGCCCCSCRCRCCTVDGMDPSHVRLDVALGGAAGTATEPAGADAGGRGGGVREGDAAEGSPPVVELVPAPGGGFVGECDDAELAALGVSAEQYRTLAVRFGAAAAGARAGCLSCLRGGRMLEALVRRGRVPPAASWLRARGVVCGVCESWCQRSQSSKRGRRACVFLLCVSGRVCVACVHCVCPRLAGWLSACLCTLCVPAPGWFALRLRGQRALLLAMRLALRAVVLFV